MSSPAERSLHATLAAYTKWGKTPDRVAATEALRRGAEERFVRMAREAFAQQAPGAVPTEREIALRAAAFRKAHFARMALRSSQARRAKAAAKGSNVA